MSCTDDIILTNCDCCGAWTECMFNAEEGCWHCPNCYTEEEL